MDRNRIRYTASLGALLFLGPALASIPAAAGEPDPREGSLPATDIVINEVFYVGNSASEDWIEFANTGTETINIGLWWVCSRFVYARLNLLTLLDGNDFILDPGEIITVQAPVNLNNGSADLGLYQTNNFASSSAMVDFVQWGTTAAVGRTNVAVTKGIWSQLGPGVYDFVPTAGPGESSAYTGLNGGGGLLTLGSDFLNGLPTRGLVPVEETTWGQIKAIYGEE